MKTALYTEDGYTQVVLTPENDFEKAALKFIESKEVEFKRGGFYQCQGGWVRHESTHYNDESNSLMIVPVNKKEK